MTVNQLISLLEVEFNAVGNAKHALQMEAYMKHNFKFLGIKSPQRKDAQRGLIHEIHTSCSIDTKWEFIFQLWNKKEREYQLVAMDLLNKFKQSDFIESDIDRLERLLIEKSWWDSVDTIASNALGVYFQKYPDQRKPITKKWGNSENIWLMRSCLIFQLKYKNEVDFPLLSHFIRKFQYNNEFFIQKAIGWSLRQYSKFEPEIVREFIEEINLTGLAKREASKYI